MNGRPEKESRSPDRAEPHEDPKRSGEGASTALEALIRQRKLAEAPDPAEPVPTIPPTR